MAKNRDKNVLLVVYLKSSKKQGFVLMAKNRAKMYYW